MSLRLQSQVLTSIQVGTHTYHVMDIRVDVGGEDLPILKDETGRLCVFSRLLSKVAGYKQKDTFYRIVQRQESLGILKEGYTHRMEPAPELHALCTRMASHFPTLEGLLFRVRTPEALLYSQSFTLLQKLSQLDLQPVFNSFLEVERALQTKSSVSADEALVDELAFALATPTPTQIPTQEAMTPVREPFGESLEVVGAEASLEGMEEAVHALATAIDIPVEEKFLENLVAKTAPKKWKRPDPELVPSWNIRDLISDMDLPQENVWVPPGYPEVYEDLTGSWIGKVYAWVLMREIDPHKRGLGANLPNLPLLLRPLLQACGFLEESGNPCNEGKYFIFQEKTGSLQFNREVLPKLLCTFLVSNPALDYRAFLEKSTPLGINIQETQNLAQRFAKGMCS